MEALINVHKSWDLRVRFLNPKNRFCVSLLVKMLQTIKPKNPSPEWILLWAWINRLSKETQNPCLDLKIQYLIFNRKTSLGCASLRKSKIGFLNPKESENGFCGSLLNRSIQNLSDRGAPRPTSMHHNQRDLRLICLVRKRKIRFRILRLYKSPILDLTCYHCWILNNQLIRYSP